MFRFVDLFAGMGGLRLGLEKALDELGIEHECVLTSEIKPYAIKVYQDNFKDSNIFGDIRQLNEKDVPDCDMVIFGSPCQSFSIAGKRLGFEDTRGTLFFEVARILKEKKPKYFLMENVENLVIHDMSKEDKKNGKQIGKTLQTMLNVFEDLGYCVNWKVFVASDYGVPQKRARIFIVGCRDKKIDLENFDRKEAVFADVQEHGLPCSNSDFSKKLFAYLSKNNLPVSFLYDKCIRDKRGGPNNLHSWDLELRGHLMDKEKNLLERILVMRRRKDLDVCRVVKSTDGNPLTLREIKSITDIKDVEKTVEKLLKMGYLIEKHKDGFSDRLFDLRSGKLSFEFTKILDPNKPCYTLVATDMQKIGVIDGHGIRKLSLVECLRLNGFPDDFILDVSYNKAMDLLGNTVVVPIVKMIAKRMLS